MENYKEIHISQVLQKVENRMVNFLESLGYKEGLEYWFQETESVTRRRLILPNFRLMKPHDLVAAFAFAEVNSGNITLSEPKQIDRNKAYLDIIARWD